jgi:Outer membrane lipoprotein-sorting protein
MIGPRKAVFTVLCLLGVTRALLPLAAAPSPDSNEEGQELAAQLRSSRPAEDLKIQGVLEIRHADGRRTKVPIQYQFVDGLRSWRDIYQTAPGTDATAEQLEVIHAEGQPNRYLYTRAGDRQGPRTLSGDQAMIPFLDSDFWLADLGREFLHWPEQRLVHGKITMRKGRPCKQLESRNPNPKATGYTRVRSFIDSDTGGVLIAEAYGPDGQLMKSFEVGGVTKVNGRWEVKDLEMRSEAPDTKTVLEFHYQSKGGE